MGLGLLFTILMCIFAPQIIKVFMDKPDIITNGAMMLRFQQIGMTFMSVSLDLNLRMSGRWKCRRSFCFIH